MPLLHIRALPQPRPELIPRALLATCFAIAETWDCSPQSVTVTWEEIRPGHYIEGGIAAQSQPAQTHPPLAELIAFEGATQEVIEVLLSETARVLGESLELGENVFITYRDAKSGQVIAGREIVR